MPKLSLLEKTNLAINEYNTLMDGDLMTYKNGEKSSSELKYIFLNACQAISKKYRIAQHELEQPMFVNNHHL